MNKILSIFLILSLLSGCGFHLRGYGPSANGTALESSKIYVTAIKDEGSVFRQLQRDLQFADAQLMNDITDADWSLVIISSEFEKKSIGVDKSGRTNEFELSISIKYEIQPMIEESMTKESMTIKSNIQRKHHFLTTNRNLYFDNNDPIGKRNEEKILLESMRGELSGRVLKVLSSKIANQ